MNKQEEARDLIDKFYQIINHNTVASYEVKQDAAKQCASMCIQCMIDYHDSLFDSGLKNVHQAMSTPVEIYNDVMNPSKQNLFELKNAIKQIETNE